jgi:hypothetical protein
MRLALLTVRGHCRGRPYRSRRGSLYQYLKSHDELLELVVDTVAANIFLTPR